MSGIAILGAGAFGTALAVALSQDGTPVTLWTRDPEHARALNRERENARRLPGIALPDTVSATAELPTSGTVLMSVPMQSLGALLRSADFGTACLVACCKGIDLDTLMGPTALIARHAPQATPAVLTGPSFAIDIARGLPTALTLACEDTERGETLQEDLSRDALRLYLSDDPVGAELGGALKNVVALAAGLAIGAGLGDSARAALVTRGFAEMQRIAASLGAHPETLQGLSGLGDLILTCTSDTSRNFRTGRLVGAGGTQEPGTTVEGIATARAMARLARDRGLDAPLAAMVADVFDGRITPDEARDLLLSRPLRKERR